MEMCSKRTTGVPRGRTRRISAGQIEAGVALAEFWNLTDEEGNPLSLEEKVLGALVVGGINAGLELWGLIAVARTIPGISKLLDLAGLEVPEYMTGYRLFGEGRGEAPLPIRTHFVNQDQRGFRTSKWKFIRNVHTNRDSIYDLESDPAEHRPVTDEAIHSELSRLYDDIERRHALAPAEEGADPVEIDDTTREQLEALGYAPE